MRRLRWLLMGMTLVACFVAVHKSFAEAPSAPSIDSFFRQREAISAKLRENIAQPLPGTKIALPLGVALDAALRPFPHREHIEFVIGRGDWERVAKTTLILDLDAEFLAEHKQPDAKTMASTELLNHYLQGLEELGFEKPGAPGKAVMRVEMVESERRIPDDPSFVVRAFVVVAPAERQAVVKLEIHEQMRQPKQ
ncbi:hypothetical protein [Blastopirellula marina]|uniref:Outer membrane lipoprotein carrier protein LolA n=1 Tax=Blastopirellula marina TaxID=124 RepID=A0A2S8GKK7_9BACT|nr:hypothetical protein [Blastopirellula marina]PQO44985.1 hypothetical protein C5Y93_15740 [Blastopirellula marina]